MLVLCHYINNKILHIGLFQLKHFKDKDHLWWSLGSLLTQLKGKLGGAEQTERLSPDDPKGD